MKKQALINNLKSIIDYKFDGNVSAFAKICDIHSPTIHNYLKGKYAPKGENLEKLARAAGMSIAELYADGSVAEEFVVKEAGILYTGPERRHNVPYTREERLYMEKLLDILRGSNKKNVSAIKENIDAFHETRNFNTSEAVKKTEAG